MGEQTVVLDYDLETDGYIIIAPLSDETRKKLSQIQEQIAERLDTSNLWLPSQEQLHITFAHIISPDDHCVYEDDRSVLFSKIGDDALRALGGIVPAQLNIPLTLEGIKASPQAIIAKWHDANGVYNKLRQQFTERFHLPEPTKRPPDIVHTTIARFRKQLDFDGVQRAVAELQAPDVKENTTQLAVINEQKIYVQRHAVVATFPQN